MPLTDNKKNQGSITVVPAALDRWSDIEQLFANHPCWCQYWRVSAQQYGRTSKDQLTERIVERRKSLRSWLEGPNPPGVMAYLDGQVAGWCGFGPRHEMERLVRSRTIPAADDQPVWSLVCFLVLPGYRRQGVARALLRGAIDCARSYGAPALEAYPVDPAGERINAASAYMAKELKFEGSMMLGMKFKQVTDAVAKIIENSC